MKAAFCFAALPVLFVGGLTIGINGQDTMGLLAMFCGLGFAALGVLLCTAEN